MKRFIAAAVAAVMMTTPVLAAQVEVNGKKIDAEAVIVDSRTLVPVRGVFEELGYTVDYNADTKTATLTKNDTVVAMTMGDTYFTVDGKQITPEVPQQIIDSRFMLPLRAVSEAIGANVEWDSETKTAVISTGLRVVEVQDFSNNTPINEITLD
jgi:opacity protein-like surface antigen